MNEKDKKLLLKDLCARLPYGVKCTCFQNASCSPYLIDFRDNTIHSTSDFNGAYIKINLDDCKLYLRPMSSMTEEEFKDLQEFSGLKYEQLDLAEFPNNHKCLDFYLEEIPSYVTILVFDWLNKNHFDYRLLIERGLALEAPEGMYSLA